MSFTFYPEIFRQAGVSKAMGAYPVSRAECLAESSKLKDRVFVVTTDLYGHTGGASGLGKAFCLDVARHGAKLVVGDIQDIALSSCLEEIKAVGGEGEVVKCDVTSWEDQKNLFEKGFARFGRVDVVVPNAGVTDVEHFAAGPKEVDGVLQAPNLLPLDVNLTGLIYSIQLGLHYLRKNTSGGLRALVLTASMSSFFGLPLNGAIYATSKHALLGLARSLHLELAHEGITTTIIAPFFVDTPLLEDNIRKLLGKNDLAKLEDVIAGIVYASTQNKADGMVINTDPSGNLAFPVHLLDLVHP